MTDIHPYTPFLKLKQNEIMALKELDPVLRESIIPFFDFPKGKDENEKSFKNHANKKSKQIEKHLGKNYQIYLDTFDTNDIIVDGIHSYEYLLSEFSSLDVIPVIGLDRTENHCQSILSAKANGKNCSDILALRILPEDFKSYTAIEVDIEESLCDLLAFFNKIDLIFDCRVCTNLDSSTIANDINQFAEQFALQYPLNKIIVTGSSIPSNIAEICPPLSEKSIERNEVFIFYQVMKDYGLKYSLVPGDYTTVSPDYSDIELDERMIQARTTSKLIYGHDTIHHIWRGGSLKTNGYDQYNAHILALTKRSFYRGQHFSWADSIFNQKKNGFKGFGPGPMIKYTINAHIAFMLKVGI